MVAEGETDSWTLLAHEIPALGVPGKKMFRRISRDIVNAISPIPVVYVVFEPPSKDDSANTFPEDVAAQLRAEGYAGTVLVIDVAKTCGSKDPSELHVRDPQAFSREWQRCVDAATLVRPSEEDREVGRPCHDRAERDDDSPAERQSQGTKLVVLVEKMGVELIRDATETPYAIVPQTNGIRKVYAVRSAAFGTFLAKTYFDAFGKVPGGAARTDARAVLEGRAGDGRLADVALRLAGGDDSVDVDLGDDHWRMAHVTRDGWSIIPHGDRLFRRAPGMLPLPEPVRGGSLAELRGFWRVDDIGLALLTSFLLCALRGRGPYPILALGGEQGAAKTTTARTILALVDPNMKDVRAEIADLRVLAVAARHAHIIAFDNVSGISAKISDALCRLATGGSFTTRVLYTDEDEMLFAAQRPVILTSITDVVTQPDLLDRCVAVDLRPIPEDERQTEEDYWARFEEARPRMLGALLDTIALAFSNVADVRERTRRMPRMADAYLWVLSAAPAFGVPQGIVEEAWQCTRDEAHATTLESSVVAGPLRLLLGPFLEDGGTWSGTATKLLDGLNSYAGEVIRQRKDWPKSSRELAAHVRAIAPALRATGIHHDEDRKPHSGDRLHIFRAIARKIGQENPVTRVTPVTTVVARSDSGDGNPRTGSHARHPADAFVTQKGCDDAAGDAGDHGDDVAAPFEEAECADSESVSPEADDLFAYCDKRIPPPAKLSQEGELLADRVE